MKQKQVATTIVFGPEHRKMISEIGEDIGQPNNLAQAVKYAIVETHRRLRPGYLQEKTKRIERPKLTPLERVKAKEDEKKAKRELFIQGKLEILKRLGGRVINYGPNHMVAQWYTYHSRGKDLQEMALDLLTEDLVNNQFHGKREEIEKKVKVVPMKPISEEEQKKLAKEYEESKG